MFRYLSGKLATSCHESVTIDILGIGFQVMIAPRSFDLLPAPGTQITLHVAFVIREFSQTLYGFLHEPERDLFEKLLSVSGIGPKLSLSIIGHLSVGQLQQALLRKDSAALCKVPGIGKKTAERLLLELKGLSLPQAIHYEPCRSPLLQDAVSALINLGYSQVQAERAVTKTLETEQEIEDLSLLLTASLRNI